MKCYFGTRDQSTIFMLLLAGVVGVIGSYSIKYKWFPPGHGHHAVEFDQHPPVEYRFRLSYRDASRQEFCLLPGIGEKLGQRLVEFRNRHPEIDSLDRLMEVKGIGRQKFEAIKQYLFLD